MFGPKPSPTFFLYAFLLLFPTFSSLEISQSPLRAPDMSCIEKGFYNCSPQCICNINQDYFNLTLIGFSGFTLIWCVLFIFCYCMVRDVRQKPAEIILVLAMTNFFLALKSMVEGLKLRHSDSMAPRVNDEICQEVGFIAMFLTNTISFYQLTFYLYKVITLKNPIKAAKITKKHYHVITLLLSLALTIGEYVFGSIGRTIMGSCSLKSTSYYYIPAILGGVFLLLSAYMSYLLRKNMLQRRKDLNLKETRYAEHYLGYLIVICIVLIGLLAIQVEFAERIRKALAKGIIEKYAFSLNILGLCVFVLTNLTPFILTLGQIRDPTVWKSLKDRLRQTFCCERKRVGRLEISNRFLEPLIDAEEKVAAGEARMELQFNPQALRQLNIAEHKDLVEPATVIQNSIPRRKHPQMSQMLCTLIAGLIYNWNQQKVENSNEKEKVIETDENYNIKKEAKVKKKLTIHETVLKKNLPQVQREIRSRNIKVRFGIFTSHAPVLFKDLIEYDGLEQELKNSIDLLRNFKNILDAETVDKEFHFITFDSKFILKSITKQERRCLLRILPDYLNHLKTNPCSLLARIYGIYKFEVMSPYQQLNWIIMKNGSERSGSCIKRMYQLKGIHLDKFAMTTDSESNIPNFPNMKGHSGEEYFERYERAIHVDFKTRQDLLKTVQRDTNFLINQGIFNYVLNVSIVNRMASTCYDQKLCDSVILEVDESLEDKSFTVRGSSFTYKQGPRIDEDEKEIDGRRGRSLDMAVNLRNPFDALQSTRENLHYSIEIDNFLTQYSLKHKFKRVLCSLCKSENDDVLVPAAYGERLLSYAKQIMNDREQIFESMAKEEIEIEKF